MHKINFKIGDIVSLKKRYFNIFPSDLYPKIFKIVSILNVDGHRIANAVTSGHRIEYDPNNARRFYYAYRLRKATKKEIILYMLESK